MYTINCKGRLLPLDRPKVMGVINLTPDSFYAGSRKQGLDEVIHRAGEMLEEGADLLDLGACSSRPGAEDISKEEELARLLPALQGLLGAFPEAIFSVDTFRAEVARQAVEAGAAIINDISAGQLDEQMPETVARLQVPYIMMHMRGTPQTMSRENDYKDICGDLITYFSERVHYCRELGINDLIIDPGFGFAKNPSQGFELLRRLKEFQLIDCPLLVGLSRKSMLYKTLDIKPGDALNATTAVNMAALERGAHLLRVHDVKEAVETVKIFTNLYELV